MPALVLAMLMLALEVDIDSIAATWMAAAPNGLNEDMMRRVMRRLCR